MRGIRWKVRLLYDAAKAIAVAILWTIVGGTFTELRPLFAAGWLLLLVGLFVWWCGRWGNPRALKRRRATLRLRAPGSTVYDALGIAAVFLFFQLAAAALITRAGLANGGAARIPHIDYLDQPLGWLPFLIAAVVCAPVVEEFIFRGMLQHPLERRLGVWPAILIAAAFFAVMHNGLGYGALPFIFGTIAGYLVYVTGSIWTGIALHAGNNLASEVASVVLPEKLGSPQQIAAAVGVWSLTALAIVSGALVLWLLCRVPVRARREAGRSREGVVILARIH